MPHANHSQGPHIRIFLFRQQFRHDLRAGRFTMEFAQSGEMALQRIADATGISLILILLDINMPGMSGLELLPKAKAARPDVPIVMITAYGDAETKRKALERAPKGFLQSRSILHRFAARSKCELSRPYKRTRLFGIDQGWLGCKTGTASHAATLYLPRYVTRVTANNA